MLSSRRESGVLVVCRLARESSRSLASSSRWRSRSPSSSAFFWRSLRRSSFRFFCASWRCCFSLHASSFSARSVRSRSNKRLSRSCLRLSSSSSCSLSARRSDFILSLSASRSSCLLRARSTTSGSAASRRGKFDGCPARRIPSGCGIYCLRRSSSRPSAGSRASRSGWSANGGWWRGETAVARPLRPTSRCGRPATMDCAVATRRSRLLTIRPLVSPCRPGATPPVSASERRTRVCSMWH
mmetsp:Transcript_19732/g.63339  ORF Transcript_19732/g.63339 Transcript_19732/m.63339 type:complete len:241 (-) Transcript_19732:165-887(-)